MIRPLTPVQKTLLTELETCWTEPENEAWLVDRVMPQGGPGSPGYALVVQTVLGDYMRKATVSSRTIGSLHEMRYIEYVGRPSGDLEFEGREPGDQHIAVRIRITEHGRAAVSGPRRARHRAR